MKICFFLIIIIISSCSGDSSNTQLLQPTNTTTEEKINYSEITFTHFERPSDSTVYESYDKGLKVVYSFDDINSRINFTFSNKNFHYLFEDYFSDGFGGYLYDSESKMIVLLDFYFEFGHDLKIFQITSEDISFVGDTAFRFQVDEQEFELPFNIQVSEVNNKIEVDLGPDYSSMYFDARKASILPLDSK